MSIALTGIGIPAETRIAIGKAFALGQSPVCVTPGWIEEAHVEHEIQRFKDAIIQAAAQLHKVRQHIPDNAPLEIAEFINTHLLMLQDQAISNAPIDFIYKQHASAEWALQQHREALIKVFENMDDSYLRTRQDDLNHVINRIQHILLDENNTTPENLHGQIVLAKDLAPADLILMKNRGAAGFVTDFGGPMSHTAILARSLDMPAIVGAHSATHCLQHGELLVLDSDNGVILADCDQQTISYFYRQRASEHSRTQNLRKRSSTRTATRDGQPITLLANIELAGDVVHVHANGAAGIGLYRTEFLYMNRSDTPTEEEHFSAYRKVVEGMQGQPVTIRTLDLGADKQAGSCLGTDSANNPALGLRAIRLCLQEPDLFLPQLRAILRVSAIGPVRMLIPMLTSTWEIDQMDNLIQRTIEQLQREGIACDPDMPVGGMIETPAAALCANSFAQRLDFLSIGTNDLIQYTLAIDRLDDEVNYLYEPFHPAVLQLIRNVVEAANACRIPVGMCGEMASDPRFVPLLLGLGMTELSMQPTAVLDIQQLISRLDSTQLHQQTLDFFQQMNDEDPQRLLALMQPVDKET